MGRLVVGVRELCLGSLLGLLGQKNSLDVGEDSALGDGDSSEELVQLFVSTGHAAYSIGRHFFKTLLRYLLQQGGCLCTRPAFLAHTKQKVGNIVDLTVLRLAFFMGFK